MLPGTAEELAFCTASTLVEALRRREISSRDLLEVYLDRVERLDAPINSVVTLDVDGARAAAAAADEAFARGDGLGPLHGLPMTIKDCWDVAGVRTTVGDPDFGNHRPVTDAPLVERLRASGAVMFGRTNVPFRLGDLQTLNPLFGSTKNPWDLERTPGGSSGGAGAALAAGLTPLDVSGDYGGSTRVPASHCGVYGLKPTFGTIPCLGMLPLPPGHRAEVDMETPGPMVRAVDDIELAFDVLAGPGDQVAKAWSLEFPKPRARTLADLRIGVWFDDETYRTDAAVLGVLRGVADQLSDAGATVEEDARPGSLEEVVEVFLRLFWGNIGGVMSASDYESVVGDAELAPSYREWFLINEHRHQLRMQWSAYFDRFDVLLTPCCVVAAPPTSDEPDITKRSIDVNGSLDPYLNVTAWAGPSNALYLPAFAIPAGLTESGLPVGLQIMTAYLEDRTALEAARRIGEVIGTFRRPPGF